MFSDGNYLLGRKYEVIISSTIVIIYPELENYSAMIKPTRGQHVRFNLHNLMSGSAFSHSQPSITFRPLYTSYVILPSPYKTDTRPKQWVAWPFAILLRWVNRKYRLVRPILMTINRSMRVFKS